MDRRDYLEPQAPGMPADRAARQPHPLLSRQAQRQGHGRLRRHRRLYRLRRQPGADLLRRHGVHERRIDPAVLFHRRLHGPGPTARSRAEDAEDKRFWQGVRASPARARRRHPLALPRPRPPARRHRKLCDEREPQPRPRNRPAPLNAAKQGNPRMTENVQLIAQLSLPLVAIIVGAWRRRLGAHHLAAGSRTAIRSKPAGACRSIRSQRRASDRADQATDRRECAAPRRARLDQGPARKPRAHRHRPAEPPGARDRCPGHRQGRAC